MNPKCVYEIGGSMIVLVMFLGGVAMAAPDVLECKAGQVLVHGQFCSVANAPYQMLQGLKDKCLAQTKDFEESVCYDVEYCAAKNNIEINVDCGYDGQCDPKPCPYETASKGQFVVVDLSNITGWAMFRGLSDQSMFSKIRLDRGRLKEVQPIVPTTDLSKCIAEQQTQCMAGKSSNVQGCGESD